MGSSEDPTTRPISLYDSSPSTPLLSKPESSSSDPPRPPSPFSDQPESSSSDPTQYLQISFNHSPRSFKDLPFLLLFLLLLLSTFAFGIFSVLHRNSNYSSLSSFQYDAASSSCVLNSTLSNSLTSSLSSSFLSDLTWTLVITLLLTLPLIFALLCLLKNYAKQVVYVSLPFFVIFPLFFDVYWFVACTISDTCSESFPLVYRIMLLFFVLLVIGVVVWIFVANWHRIELTISIIGVASDALSRNLGLFLILPLILAGLVALYAPIVVFLVFSRLNGEIVAEEDDDGVYACVWKQDAWVPAYYALAILTMLWCLTATVEAQVYVISGTVAQWYFAKEDSKPKRAIRSSLR